MQGLESLGDIVASLAAVSNIGKRSSVGNGMIFRLSRKVSALPRLLIIKSCSF
jgi:hypothetical protein